MQAVRLLVSKSISKARNSRGSHVDSNWQECIKSRWMLSIVDRRSRWLSDFSCWFRLTDDSKTCAKHCTGRLIWLCFVEDFSLFLDVTAFLFRERVTTADAFSRVASRIVSQLCISAQTKNFQHPPCSVFTEHQTWLYWLFLLWSLVYLSD